MASFPTVYIPAYEFHFNLVVCPLPPAEIKTVSIYWIDEALSYSFQGSSYYFVLKDNGSQGIRTGGTHWLRFLPNHLYCFLPSLDSDKGHVKVFDYIPEYLKDFQFCMEIDQVENKI